MTSISSINSAALQIMRQYQPSSPSAGDGTSVGNNIVAAANGMGVHTADARAKVSESIFSVNHLDVTKMKLDLMEKVGKAFGIDRDEYDSQASYGFAIRHAVSQIKQQPDGFQILAKIEKDLGLDKLGLSIDEMVNAIIDPGGSDGDKLDAALKEQIGEDKSGESNDGRNTPGTAVELRFPDRRR